MTNLSPATHNLLIETEAVIDQLKTLTTKLRHAVAAAMENDDVDPELLARARTSATMLDVERRTVHNTTKDIRINARRAEAGK